MPALATRATKRQNVIKPGSQSDSKIEFKVIMKSIFGGFMSKKNLCESICFYCLKHTSNASWTQQFPLKSRFGTLRETLSKKNSQRSAIKRLLARLYEETVSKCVPKASQLSSQGDTASDKNGTPSWFLASLDRPNTPTQNFISKLEKDSHMDPNKEPKS